MRSEFHSHGQRTYQLQNYQLEWSSAAHAAMLSTDCFAEFSPDDGSPSFSLHAQTGTRTHGQACEGSIAILALMLSENSLLGEGTQSSAIAPCRLQRPIKGRNCVCSFMLTSVHQAVLGWDVMQSEEPSKRQRSQPADPSAASDHLQTPFSRHKVGSIAEVAKFYCAVHWCIVYRTI